MLVVNLFGGPGTGKSTHAAGLFHKLKWDGFNAEYVQEYAKDRTWGKDFNTLLFQPYVTGKQFHRQARLLGNVDVAVTDSPILTGLVYQGFGCTPSWEQWALEAFGLFDNLNIYLIRNTEIHPYNPGGRSQSEEEAIQKDRDMRAILDSNGISYYSIKVDERSLEKIYALIRERLEQKEIPSLRAEIHR